MSEAVLRAGGRYRWSICLLLFLVITINYVDRQVIGVLKPVIEDDLGPELARRVAQQLVVHQRRAGGQSQFSGLVDTGGRSGRFSELLDWVHDNLAKDLTVERLAERAAMSPRHFSRAFVTETGTTPAKAVERLRVEAARLALETTHVPLQRVAEASGFGDPGRMRRSFLRVFGQPPQALRESKRVLNDALSRSVAAVLEQAVAAETASFEEPAFRENLAGMLKRSNR